MKVPKIPDPRPSKAHPDARTARKAFERENPHFNMQEFGMKAGALALLTAVALFPWEKEHEKHERAHHPERFEDNGKGDRIEPSKSKEKGRKGKGEIDRRRRQSEGGEREREYRYYLDRDRDYRPLVAVGTAPSSVGGGSGGGSGARGIERERRYTGTEDGEYGRRYIEASVRERERTGRGSGEYGRRRRGDSVDYEYRRSKREEWRR